MKRLLLLAFGTLVLSAAAQAQSAVYICSSTGAYGYCYGTANVATCAYDRCVSYGGKSCQSAASTSLKGYGAIAKGKDSQGRTVIGAGFGYANEEGAKQRARQECVQRGGQQVVIVDTYLDR